MASAFVILHVSASTGSLGFPHSLVVVCLAIGYPEPTRKEEALRVWSFELYGSTSDTFC